MDLDVRDVDIADAEAVVGILNPIVEARIYTAFTEPFTVDAEREYISMFPARGVWKVAMRRLDRRVVGFQILEPFGSVRERLDHVATVGTYVDLAQRRRASRRRSLKHLSKPLAGRGYEKIFTFVRADNAGALAAYRARGFEIVGTARGHAKIDGRYIDEILIEKALASGKLQGSS